MTTEPDIDLLQRTQSSAHPRCVVCSRQCADGLGLQFTLQPNGSVSAEFSCPSQYEGYGGLLHGGVISTVADGAMTNCLFAHGIEAVTAELNVRFRHPIEIERPLTVTAHIARRSRPLFVVEAELVQADQLRATATGKFMEHA